MIRINILRFLNSIVPEYTGVITEVKTNVKAMALTFDDGPHPVYTPQLLDILKKHGAKATFFLIGKEAKKYPDVVKRIFRDGHSVGNHTWGHKSMPMLTRNERIMEITKCADSVGLSIKKFFRPPHGHYSLKSTRDIRDLGYEVIMWSVDVEDWMLHHVEPILEKLKSKSKPGSIILLHDGLYSRNNIADESRIHTIFAVNTFLQDMKYEYRFVTVDTLLKLGKPVRTFWYRKNTHNDIIRSVESQYLSADHITIITEFLKTLPKTTAANEYRYYYDRTFRLLWSPARKDSLRGVASLNGTCRFCLSVLRSGILQLFGKHVLQHHLSIYHDKSDAYIFIPLRGKKLIILNKSKQVVWKIRHRTSLPNENIPDPDNELKALIKMRDGNLNSIFPELLDNGVIGEGEYHFIKIPFFENNNPIQKNEWGDILRSVITKPLIEFYAHTGIDRVPAELYINELAEKAREKNLYRRYHKEFIILEKLIERYDPKVYTTFVHGDLTWFNTHRDKSKVKVIDWEGCRRDNLLYDLFYQERWHITIDYWESVHSPVRFRENISFGWSRTFVETLRENTGIELTAADIAFNFMGCLIDRLLLTEKKDDVAQRIRVYLPKERGI